jgi:hypothetical protein
VKLEKLPGVPVAVPIVPTKLPPAVVFERIVVAPDVITIDPKSSSPVGEETDGIE